MKKIEESSKMKYFFILPFGKSCRIMPGPEASPSPRRHRDMKRDRHIIPLDI